MHEKDDSPVGEAIRSNEARIISRDASTRTFSAMRLNRSDTERTSQRFAAVFLAGCNQRYPSWKAEFPTGRKINPLSLRYT